ncbi:hypothetical protein F5Y10DRAFT_236838 [Nemania abortiva]|nr:hypothetical protein F5Y10DRAFT_236838 [Nemania abortiva]
MAARIKIFYVLCTATSRIYIVRSAEAHITSNGFAATSISEECSTATYHCRVRDARQWPGDHKPLTHVCNKGGEGKGRPLR